MGCDFRLALYVSVARRVADLSQFIPSLAVGAAIGRIFALGIEFLYTLAPDASVFASCDASARCRTTIHQRVHSQHAVMLPLLLLLLAVALVA